jgi:hypothetical protein
MDIAIPVAIWFVAGGGINFIFQMISVAISSICKTRYPIMSIPLSLSRIVILISIIEIFTGKNFVDDQLLVIVLSVDTLWSCILTYWLSGRQEVQKFSVQYMVGKTIGSFIGAIYVSVKYFI